MRKRRQRQGQALPSAPRGLGGRQFSPPHGDQVEGGDATEQGGGRPSGGAFQAVAGGLQGQADEPRPRPADPRSSEQSPGCWRCGGSCRWSTQPAPLLTSPSLPHRGTTAQRSLRCLGKLSSVAGGGGVCMWRERWGLFEGDSEQTPRLFKREFYHGNRFVVLGWHGVAQQAGTRIFRARSNESKWQFAVSSGLKASARSSVIGGRVTRANGGCCSPAGEGARAQRG